MCNTLLYSRNLQLELEREWRRMAECSYQICLVHEPKTDRLLATDPVFAGYQNVGIWIQSVKKTYPDWDVPPFLENVIYTAPDGFRFYWSKLQVWHKAEEF